MREANRLIHEGGVKVNGKPVFQAHLRLRSATIGSRVCETGSAFTEQQGALRAAEHRL